MSKPVNRKERNQGMNWIRKEKRLAIYLRDGLACVYCGSGIEDEVKLTLDHLTPHSHGGSNAADNLVTCCHKCNSVRGNRSWTGFAKNAATYTNTDAEALITFIDNTVTRPLDVPAAKALIARRGGFVNACKG